MRILIVQDGRQSKAHLIDWLSHEGHDVVGITGGAHAVSRIQNQHIDLVLLDIRLPDVDGLKIVSEVAMTGAKVIVMSGLLEETWADEAYRQGAFGCLAKPLSLTKLKILLAAAEVGH